MNKAKLENYLKRDYMESCLVFSLDINYQIFNNKIKNLINNFDNIYGLIRVQNNYSINDVLNLLDNERFIGLKFHPTFDRFPITNQVYRSLFSLLQEQNKLALIHCGRWKEVAHFSFAYEIADLYPNLNLILAHMGGNELSNSLEAIDLARSHPNVYFDTSNCRIPLVIKKAVENLGDRRIMFGSDIPWGSCLGNAFTIVESDISETSKKRIFHENFMELLRKVI